MDQGRAACLALVGDDEDECDVSCCHLARYQDPGDHPDVVMSYRNIQYTKRRFSTRGHLIPEYCCSVPEGGYTSTGNRDGNQSIRYQPQGDGT